LFFPFPIVRIESLIAKLDRGQSVGDGAFIFLKTPGSFKRAKTAVPSPPRGFQVF
jgi:hypothetical protein